MLSDTAPFIPETGATVSIQTEGGGVSYALRDSGSNGMYVSDPLSLDMSRKYILTVVTANGEKYASDPVTPKQTPPIDSLSWSIGLDVISNNNALNIYVNTHDALGNTKFYRWDFTETWEHESPYRSYYYVLDDTLLVFDSLPPKHNWQCWSNAASSNILLGSSENLSADIIPQTLINRIYFNDPRIDVKYSILVRQYALDSSAYDYWTLVQKQSQTLGGLFDIIPAQLTGNFHNLKNPAEPVYGYVSASTIQEQRIFINHQQIPDWKSIPQQCTQYTIYPDSIPGDTLWYRIYSNVDPNFTFLQFSKDRKNKTIQLFESTSCVDCTFQGGSTIKPPFWQ